MRSSLAWGAIAGLSGVVTWATWRGPASHDTATVPDPLPRPATPSERAQLNQYAQTVLSELQEATEVLGRPPRLDELEGTLPDGRPVLSSGLPDNPLVEGVAVVGRACPGDPNRPGWDWRYCDEPGRLAFAPVFPDYRAPTEKE